MKPTKNYSPFKVDLFIKSNIELTKDIYPASVKSNYILKYVFANGISRDIIYPLLVKMNLMHFKLIIIESIMSKDFCIS